MANFPSVEHWKELKKKAAVYTAKRWGGQERTGVNLDKLDDLERRQYHAYDYAWRAKYGYPVPSPIDREGHWHKAAGPALIADAGTARGL